jgi:cysteinyl-tRNA synthetase
MFELQEDVSELENITDIEDKIKEISSSSKSVSDGIQSFIDVKNFDMAARSVVKLKYLSKVLSRVYMNIYKYILM